MYVYQVCQQTEGTTPHHLPYGQVDVLTAITLPPKSHTFVELGFRPLLPGDFRAQLRLRSAELGDYTYPLLLRGTSPAPAPAISFATPLGSTQTQVRGPLIVMCRKRRLRVGARTRTSLRAVGTCQGVRITWALRRKRLPVDSPVSIP